MKNKKKRYTKTIWEFMDKHIFMICVFSTFGLTLGYLLLLVLISVFWFS